MPIKLAETLLVAPAASITFSGIPATFSHLEIEWHARGDVAGTSTTILLRLNNDSGANYDDQRIRARERAEARSKPWSLRVPRSIRSRAC